ncbi:hypothetical protein V8E51_005751 [Hyaloscypha variabilis]
MSSKMFANETGPLGSEERARTTKTSGNNVSHEERYRRLVKSTPSKSTRITLRGTKPVTSTRPPWNSGSLSPTTSKTPTAQPSARTLPRKLPSRGLLPTQENSSQSEQKNCRNNDIAATVSGTNITKELRCALAGSQLLQDGIEEKSFNDSDMFTSPRLKLPLSSPAQIKCDPAIIACGPRITDRDTILRPDTNTSIIVPMDSPEKIEKGDHLEYFRKTLGRLKKVDRKAIRELLRCLKNLDSDEEQTTESKRASKAALKMSSKFSQHGKVSQVHSKTSNVTSTVSNTGKGLNVASTVPKNRKASLRVPSTFSNTGILNPLAPAFREFAPKQEPIWINTFQTPTIIEQEDDGFRDFCRANNFIPLVPVPISSMNSLTTPYVTFKPDPVFTSAIPFNDKGPILPIIPGAQIQSLGNNMKTSAHDFISLLEETSEPVEEDAYREAKALDPAWGGQILENFMKKYPLTGRLKSDLSASKHITDSKAAATVQQKPKPKAERKVRKAKPHSRAAEIQQKLEMTMLQQREKNAPLAPAHKVKATEIQQRLEIMLFMLKEQKALESFSKLVCS